MPGLSMDPLSAGASVMSSAMSMLEGAANRRFQKEENQKNRDFNASESQKSRAYNSRMVAQQNEFNSPQAMMRRLNDAGINPAMAYSQGVGSLGSIGTGSTSQQASYHTGVSPVMSDMSGIQQAGLLAAHASLVKNQSKGEDLDNENKEFRNMINTLTKDNLVQLSNLSVSNASLDGKIKGQELKNLGQEYQRLGSATSLLVNMSSREYQDAELKKLDVGLRERMWDSIVQMQDLSVKEKSIIVDYLADSLSSQIALNFASANAQNALAKRYGFENIRDMIDSGAPLSLSPDGELQFDLGELLSLTEEQTKVKFNEAAIHGNKFVLWSKTIIGLLCDGLNGFIKAASLWNMLDPYEETIQNSDHDSNSKIRRDNKGYESYEDTHNQTTHFERREKNRRSSNRKSVKKAENIRRMFRRR